MAGLAADVTGCGSVAKVVREEQKRDAGDSELEESD
jgi:hypothetical protein